MDTFPLSHHFGRRLDRLDQEIRHSLEEVRRHIQALEEVEKSADLPAGEEGDTFAELLRKALDESKRS